MLTVLVADELAFYSSVPDNSNNFPNSCPVPTEQTLWNKRMTVEQTEWCVRTTHMMCVESVKADERKQQSPVRTTSADHGPNWTACPAFDM